MLSTSLKYLLITIVIMHSRSSIWASHTPSVRSERSDSDLPGRWPPSTPQGRPSASSSTSPPPRITRARSREIAWQWEDAVNLASWASEEPAYALLGQNLPDDSAFHLSHILEEESDYSPLPTLSDNDVEGWEAFSDSEGGQLFDDESDLGDPFFNATLNVTTATLLLTDNLPLLNDPTLAEYAHALVEGISALASSGALARLFHNEDVNLNQHDTLRILRDILRRFYPRILDINDLPMGPNDRSTDLPDIPELVSPSPPPAPAPLPVSDGEPGEVLSSSQRRRARRQRARAARQANA